MPANITAAHAPRPAAGARLTYRSGDADVAGQLEQWIPGHDLVVDAAAPYPLYWTGAAQAAALTRLAVERTARLIGLLQQSAARYVLLGSFASAPPEGSLVARAVHGGLRAAHPYFALKERIELQVREAIARGVDALLLRPTYCLGPGDTSDPALALIPMLLRGQLPAVNAQPMNIIDTRDVARMLVRAARRADVAARCIDIVGHNTTLEQLAGLAHRLGAAPPPATHVPAAFGAAVAYAAERAGQLAGQATRVPSVGTLLLLAQRWELPSAPQRALHMPLRPLARTVADTIDWYRAPWTASGAPHRDA